MERKRWEREKELAAAAALFFEASGIEFGDKNYTAKFLTSCWTRGKKLEKSARMDGTIRPDGYFWSKGNFDCHFSVRPIFILGEFYVHFEYFRSLDATVKSVFPNSKIKILDIRKIAKYGKIDN